MTKLTGTDRYSNIIKEKAFQEEALTAMKTISNSMAKSVGYYGSTTIIEDAILGHKITKDGYTILQALKFDPSYPIANTILNFIKNISKTLVTEVGDGSTSSVLTSNALFQTLTEMENKLPFSRKELLDRLETYRAALEDEIRSVAIPVTADNLDVLRNIATVSNNNDEKSGDLVFQAFKEVGTDGFVRLADSYDTVDWFEVTNGMELARGYYDEAYADRGSMTIEYENPYILIFKGALTKADEEWFTGFMGFYFQKTRNPLVVIADGFDKTFNDLIKINKRNNERQGIIIDITLIAANSTKEEEVEDLATYLGATILDKDDIGGEFEDFKFTFLSTDYDKIAKALDFEESRYPFGSAKRAFIDLNDSKFVEGMSKPEAIAKRLEEISMQIDYYKSLGSKTNTEFEIYKLRKRASNLQAKIATIFISGASELEKETRKYLFEDAVYATKSAMEHGYISGGNLAVSKAIKRLLNKQELVKDQYDMLLINAIDKAFRETFCYVLTNYQHYDTAELEEVISTCVVEDKIFNLANLQYEDDATTTIINSVNTDILIMNTTFSIIGLLVASNQYIGKI